MAVETLLGQQDDIARLLRRMGESSLALEFLPLVRQVRKGEGRLDGSVAGGAFANDLESCHVVHAVRLDQGELAVRLVREVFILVTRKRAFFRRLEEVHIVPILVFLRVRRATGNVQESGHRDETLHLPDADRSWVNVSASSHLRMQILVCGRPQPANEQVLDECPCNQFLG